MSGDNRCWEVQLALKERRSQLRFHDRRWVNLTGGATGQL